jgi:hypothetical protein
MAPDLGRIEVAGRAGMHDLTALHDAAVVGDFPAKVQILRGREGARAPDTRKRSIGTTD